MTRMTRNGQTWETRNLWYAYYEGEPCKVIDLRGDFDTYKADDTVLLQAETLGNGWVRYWTTSTDPEERASLASVIE
jgi:hypothetical protein